MPAPVDIQIIGPEVAIRWDDGQESYITFATLRAASPSAEVKGERDIFGTVYGGDGAVAAPALAAYMLASDKALALAPADRVIAGDIPWPTIPPLPAEDQL